MSAYGQQQALGPNSVKIDKPTVEMALTPEYEYSGAGKKKVPKSREWLEIEFPFKTNARSATGYVDTLTFQYYLMVQTAAGTAQMLSDSFVYNNIPDDEEVYSIIYISPTVLARLAGGKDKFAANNLVGWGVEVLHNGRVIAEAAQPSGRWWQERQGTPGLILKKSQTPFSMLWIDRHVSEAQP